MFTASHHMKLSRTDALIVSGSKDGYCDRSQPGPDQPQVYATLAGVDHLCRRRDMHHCTDVSAVISAAFVWNLLIPKLPLAAACAITVADALIILLAYSPTGTLRSIRFFEIFMAGLVIAVFIPSAVVLGQVSSPQNLDSRDSCHPARSLSARACTTHAAWSEECSCPTPCT